LECRHAGAQQNARYCGGVTVVGRRLYDYGSRGGLLAALAGHLRFRLGALAAFALHLSLRSRPPSAFAAASTVAVCASAVSLRADSAAETGVYGSAVTIRPTAGNSTVGRKSILVGPEWYR
jgi:hypothetical protein